MRNPKRSWWIDTLAIFALTCLLIASCFKAEYFDNWASIESTFIADGRLLSENLPHRHWLPNWYCGTRADYIYPPALRYGVALISKGFDVSPARAYHLYIGFFYALGIMAVYVLVRVGSGARGPAWLASAAVAMISPAFLFFHDMRRDSMWGAPQRLHALIRYGEGPHISALSILPLVFAFAILAYRTGGQRWVIASGIAAAAVVSNNFYGATALAIFFPVLVWSYWLVTRDRSIWWKSAAIAGVAYCLTAWWLVPSFVRITVSNLRHVAEPGNTRSRIIVFSIVAIAMALSWWLARRQSNGPAERRAWVYFAVGSAFAMSLYVLGRLWFHLQVTGETTRLVPELDMALILLGVVLLHWMWRTERWVVRIVAIVLAIACFIPSIHYLRYRRGEFAKDYNWKNRVEYKTTTWMYENFPNTRVLATGSVRFWFNVWHSGIQVDGGSQQGLLNQHIALSEWRVLAGNDMELARMWLQALAVDVAMIPEPNSKEWYHDVSHWKLWRTTFPIIREDGEGNVYYRIPRRTPGLARLVASERMRGLPPIPGDVETEQIRAYVAAVETEPPGGPDGERVRWHRKHPDAVTIDATVRDGESVLFAETYDPSWRATSGGRELPIKADPLSFMVIEAPPGTHQIKLEFTTPTEVRVGRWLSLLMLVYVAGLAFRHGARRFRKAPAAR